MKSFRLPRTKLSVLSLSASTFLIVSGGPYGLEEVIQKTGYTGALIILFALPLLWALPTGLMVGELAAALPEEGGFCVWVRRAMGPFWGFQEAWLSLASSIFDMAAYPAVFVFSLGQLWPPALEDTNRLMISALLILLSLGWNLLGVGAVGKGSVALGAFLLIPFVILVGASAWHVPRAMPLPSNSIPPDWFGGILVAMWNYTGWDNASTVAQEVHEPQRTYPRVMLWTLAWVIVIYTLPVFAARWAGIPSTAWATGSWVGIAEMLGGRWLGTIVLLGTMVSVVGMMNSLTMSYSRIPFALAQEGYAPRALLRQLPNGAPWVALLACSLAWVSVLGFSFDRILLLDILLYGLSLILEFVALVILRVREPRLDRPFRVPGGTAGAIAVGIGPAGLLIAAFVASRHQQGHGVPASSLAALVLVVGVAIYAIQARNARRTNGRRK